VSAHDTTTTSTADGAIPGPRGSADQPVDTDRLEQLLGQVVSDLGAAYAAPLVRIGDRLGLFTALADGGSTTPHALAERTGTDPRYVAEWLLAMAGSGYVEHEGDDRYAMSPEQAALFADEDSPAFMLGGFQLQTAAVRAFDRLARAFRTGEGMGWHEHHEDVFEGTERFFRPSYLAQLTTSWIPALPGLEERLRRGAQVADVGCGLGASTRIMAQAYPASSFVGTDYHEQSIALARERAEAAGLSDRLRFDTVSADRLSGHYDLVTLFDCVHDMPDPLGALQSVRQAVRDDGWVLMVEPISGDRVEDSLNPVGRVYAAASLFLCLPSGLSAEPRAGLGNQAGPARTLALAEQAGFTRTREAARTPFNIVYELRP
jgi:2-polyprenyl-3-methyl-5-hydroxy-6-metoxy-1,4-benzoquinol methylase